jgi:hypothetical protein
MYWYCALLARAPRDLQPEAQMKSAPCGKRLRCVQVGWHVIFGASGG